MPGLVFPCRARRRGALPEHVGTVVLQIHGLFHAVGGVGGAGPVGLGADRVDTPVRPAVARHLHQAVVDVLAFVVDGLRVTVLSGHLQPFGQAVDGDDPVRAEHLCALDRELADRPTAPDGDRVLWLGVGVLGGHVPRREHVREKEHLLVREVRVDLDGADVRIGDR